MSRRTVAVTLFVVGTLALALGMKALVDAYRWVEHTSTVRMAIGKSIGDGCDKLTTDLDDFRRLTADNPEQQRRYEQLKRLQPSVCAGDGGSRTQLVATLSDADAEERDLLVRQRTRLDTIATVAMTTFVVAIAVAFAVALSASLARSRLLESLARSEERFRLLAETATDLIRVHDATGKSTYVTPSCERLLGYTQDEMLALTPVVELVHPDERELLRQYLVTVNAEEHVPPLTHRFRLKAGEYRWFETRTHPVREAGKLVRFYTASRDIHDRVAAEKKLEAVAVTDELTGLYNRRGFTMLAGHEHRLAIRQGRGLLLMYADLDGLKAINDGLGHEHGDAALRDFADLLRKTFCASDVLARLGGDEYAALAFDVGGDDATLENRILEAIRAFNQDSERPYRLSASVGLRPATSRRDETARGFVSEADRRMYEKKRSLRS